MQVLLSKKFKHGGYAGAQFGLIGKGPVFLPKWLFPTKMLAPALKPPATCK